MSPSRTHRKRTTEIIFDRSNILSKNGDDGLDVWVSILARWPNARLIVKNGALIARSVEDAYRFFWKGRQAAYPAIPATQSAIAKHEVNPGDSMP